MAQRRCLHTLTRGVIALLPLNPTNALHHSPVHHSLQPPPSLPNHIPTKTPSISTSYTTFYCFWSHHRYFSSNSRDESENDNEEDEDSAEEEGSDEEEATGPCLKREYSAEEKEREASTIGYKVVGPLQKSDRVFKPFEPVFAVVQIGSHQFKVSNGDCIFTERLKFCEVNDKLILNKVLLLGSTTQTIVGRPLVPDAVVHAVVEEHALDAKVIIFKKKRRKNYRRTKGHRQELSKLRIADIQGIERPEMKIESKPKKAAVEKQQKVEVTA